ncbi:MAG: cytochrome P450 [Gammaproteobacteria bacterium]|nr:cytochrome P450 [Chromatiales bacterium]MYA30434.1 cytochrome P450 [Gammaproteobacteria bacterium]MYE49427.1 cytochrome P450 [Gammaproteobacteria bacterium]MYF68204.1 cytochrome P450 [Gammaproteobacteria bacterium]MYK37472.1 cytochrome P450 [Gammaproteobacteria bacterium]
MRESAASPDNFTIADPAVQECPYDYYRALHQSEPVHYDPNTDLWMIASYELAVEALNNWKVFSSAIDMRRDVGGPDASPSDALFEKEGYVVHDVLSQVDPPRHTIFRKLVDRTFTGPVVRRMEDYLTRHTEQLIDGFIDRGRCDFFNEFAVPLPLGVIADQLGVPKEDMPRFKTWSDAFIETLGIMLSPERKLECTRLIIEYQHYFVERIEEKKSRPEDDILSGLVAARHDDGSELTTEETLALVQQLLVAGNETTRNHLAKSVLLLIENPDQQQVLREDLSLVPNFVEESLRLESPVQGLFRVTTEDTELGGYAIPKGAKIYLAYGAANRDDRKFPQAETLNVRRRNAIRHLAFSHGIHRCIGQMLARKELEIAIGAILRRMTDIALDEAYPHPAHAPSFILRGLTSLHITFSRAA